MHGMHGMQCGRMWQRDGGVDILCALGGTQHKLRVRYCLDAQRAVRLIATGAAGSELIRAEITGKGIKCTPHKFTQALRACVRNAARLLLEEARKYLATFSPPCRAMLDLSILKGVIRCLRKQAEIHTNHMNNT
jgi:hypothetical protein